MKYLLLSFVFSFLLFACGGVPSYLEGEWTYSDHFTDTVNGGGYSWFITYKFDGKSYTKEGYPPLTEKGMVTPITESGDSLLLEFTPDKDSGTEKYEHWITRKTGQKFLVIDDRYFYKSE